MEASSSGGAILFPTAHMKVSLTYLRGLEVKQTGC